MELRILVVEDSEMDAELELLELRRAGLRFESRRVETEASLRNELENFRPHLILSDFSMPQFNGMKALAVCREVAADTPFIFISGTLGEDVAVNAMKAGASDYVTKANSLRLVPAVLRELKQADSRRGRRVAEAALDRAQKLAKLGYVVTGPDGAFETWSDTLVALVAGGEALRMPRSTRDWLQLVHPDDRAMFRETSVAAARTRARAEVKYRLLRVDGECIHIRQTMEPLEVAEVPGRMRWINTILDITDQALAEEKILRLNRVYAVLSAINGLIVRVRSRDELFHEACRIAVEQGSFPMAWIGIHEASAGRIVPSAWNGTSEAFFAAAASRLSIHEAPSSPVAVAVRERQAFVSNDIEADERMLLKKEHAERGIRSVAILPLVVEGEVTGVLSLHAAEAGFFDDAEMKLLRELAGDISFAIGSIKKDEKLNYLAYYDSLTGLANRTLFLERLTQSIEVARREHALLGLVVVDIERFKAINDSLGRQSADALLQQVAERMSRLRDPGKLARIGPDQFAIQVVDLRHENDLARLLDERLRLVFGPPYDLGGTQLRVAARAGIAVFPNDGADADTLFRNAEAALKRTKATGARHLFYEQEMTARVSQKLSLENKLRQALENDEFVLHYQPKIHLESRTLSGAEALIRWQSPELGLVPPMQFIPLMEETGLILEAGVWALKQAVRDQIKWRKDGLAAPRVAVNVSAIQLRERKFVEVLQAAIRAGGMPPAIDLEITESLVMEDIESNIARLRQVRALGIGVAIDDFGTGHSSLAYLAKLPVDALKIDRSFIITMSKDSDTMTLVETIVSLAHSLKLKVVAEGVDSEDQAAVLRRLRCDQLQGYLFSKPLPPEQFAGLLARNGR